VNNSSFNVLANVTSGKITGTGHLSVGALGTAETLTLASNSGTTTLGALTVITSSKLDITNNTVRINFGTPANDPIVTIAGYLKTGFNSNRWTGAGIESSTAAANPSVLAVGYADGNADPSTATRISTAL
jgi:hypothetical protein